jgi:O-antigen/teichoic acid export membrane protein
MTMRSGIKDRNGAVAVYQSAFLLIVILSLVIFLVALLVLAILPLAAWVDLEYISTKDLRAILLVLVTHVLVNFFFRLWTAAYWCSGYYPLAAILSAAAHLIEFSALAVAVFFGGSPLLAATAYLGGRIAAAVVLWGGARFVSPWLYVRGQHFSVDEMRRLVAPALSSLLFPLGNALNIQGTRIIIGSLLGPASLAIFVPLRTLSRFVLQIGEIVKSAVSPEMSLSYRSNPDSIFLSLFYKALRLTFWSSVLAAALAGIFGDHILRTWTGGAVQMNHAIYGPLLVAVVLASFWNSAISAFTSTNRHVHLALPFFFIYGVIALAAVYLGTLCCGMPGAGVSLAAVDFLFCVYIVWALLRLRKEGAPVNFCWLFLSPSTCGIFRRHR